MCLGLPAWAVLFEVIKPYFGTFHFLPVLFMSFASQLCKYGNVMETSTLYRSFYLYFEFFFVMFHFELVSLSEI